MIKLLKVITTRTGKNKMNSREQLVTEGFSFQQFSYAQLRERCKIDNNSTFRIEQQRQNLKLHHCTDDEHVIAKMCKPLLKFVMEDKEFWTQHFVERVGKHVVERIEIHIILQPKRKCLQK